MKKIYFVIISIFWVGIIIAQTNNRSFKVSIPGYPTKTGQTIVHNNVTIQGGFTAIIIDNR
jgi:hypothetical protein